MATVNHIKNICRSILSHPESKEKSIIIWGPPGIGKTDLLTQLANELNARYKVFLTATMDPTDVVGVPFPINGVTHFMPPYDFNELTVAAENQGPLVACFDDIPAGNESVFNSLLRVFQNREVAGKKIRDNVFLCGTGNRAEDRANARDLGTALNNRFVHFDMTVNNDEWREWALDHGVPKEIVGFIGAHPDKLHDFRPEESDRAFPTPRSVVTAGVMQKALGLENSSLFTALTGACGEAWAVQYQAYLKNTELSVPAEEIIRNPSKCKVPEDVDVIHATIASLTYYMKELSNKATEEKNQSKKLLDAISAAFIYGARFKQPEFTVTSGRDLINNIITKMGDLAARSKALETDGYVNFCEKFGRYIAR